MIKKIKEFLANNWYKMLLEFLFCLITVIVCACAWKVITKYNPEESNNSTRGSVKIDVCLSDSLSQKMNGNIEGMIKMLERMESDSIAVEVSKIRK